MAAAIVNYFRESSRQRRLPPARLAELVGGPRYSFGVSLHRAGTAEQVLRTIELFTGAGGLALGLDATGTVEHLLTVEMDRRACATLRLNIAHDLEGVRPPSRPWPLIEGDIRDVSFSNFVGNVDVVAGGVPCQPWSLGGAHRGYDDKRNLWPELFRAVRETRPRAVLAENVKGLLRPSFREYYEYILDSLAAPFDGPRPTDSWRDHHARLKQILSSPPSDPTERYIVEHHLVNAADYGVPQQRWRVFVVAFRSDQNLERWEFPKPTHSESALYHQQRNGSYWQRHGLRSDCSVVRNSGEGANLKPWNTMRDAIQGLPAPLGHKTEHPDWADHVGWEGARVYPGHTPNALDRPAKTVKAGVHGVPGGESVLELDDGSIRYMTVRETARVMTFPDHWRFAGPRGEQMRQLGNAVPVELAAVVAKSVADVLHQRSDANAKHTWRTSAPADDEWRAPAGRSLAEARVEQDQAAGGRHRRQICVSTGHSVIASIELKRGSVGRRIYANLRYSVGGRTVSKYIGEVDHGSRIANLKAAWILARDSGLLDGAGR